MKHPRRHIKTIISDKSMLLLFQFTHAFSPLVRYRMKLQNDDLYISNESFQDTLFLTAKERPFANEFTIDDAPNCPSTKTLKSNDISEGLIAFDCHREVFVLSDDSEDPHNFTLVSVNPDFDTYFLKRNDKCMAFDRKNRTFALRECDFNNNDMVFEMQEVANVESLSPVYVSHFDKVYDPNKKDCANGFEMLKRYPSNRRIVDLGGVSEQDGFHDKNDCTGIIVDVLETLLDDTKECDSDARKKKGYEDDSDENSAKIDLRNSRKSRRSRRKNKRRRRYPKRVVSESEISSFEGSNFSSDKGVDEPTVHKRYVSDLMDSFGGHSESSAIVDVSDVEYVEHDEKTPARYPGHIYSHDSSPKIRKRRQIMDDHDESDRKSPKYKHHGAPEKYSEVNSLNEERPECSKPEKRHDKRERSDDSDSIDVTFENIGDEYKKMIASNPNHKPNTDAEKKALRRTPLKPDPNEQEHMVDDRKPTNSDEHPIKTQSLGDAIVLGSSKHPSTPEDQSTNDKRPPKNHTKPLPLNKKIKMKKPRKTSKNSNPELNSEDSEPRSSSESPHKRIKVCTVVDPFIAKPLVDKLERLEMMEMRNKFKKKKNHSLYPFD